MGLDMCARRSAVPRVTFWRLASFFTTPVITLKKAVDNVRPMLEVKSRRVGGASYQVPIEVKPQRGTTLARSPTRTTLARGPSTPEAKRSGACPCSRRADSPRDRHPGLPLTA